MKNKYIIFLLTTIHFIFLITTGSVSASDTDFVINNITSDKAGKLFYIGGEKKDKKTKIKYNITKLTDPSRLVIDIENAFFKKGNKSIDINNDKFTEKARISQFSNDPDVVRIVFTANSPEILDAVEIKTFKNNLVFELEKVEFSKILNTSVYKDRNDFKNKKKEEDKTTKISENKEVKEKNSETIINPENVNTNETNKLSEIEKKQRKLDEIKKKTTHNIIVKNINNYNNRIFISGTGIISVVEPFILEEPSRIIFDIADAVLDKADLINEFSLKNKDSVKIAQFNSKTVRIAIESKNPKEYINIFSPDLQSIIISPKKELSFDEFPNGKTAGEIVDIKVAKKDSSEASIVFMSKIPMVHSIERKYSPDRLNLTLYNIKTPDIKMLDKIEETGQIKGISIGPAENFPEGSKWMIPLSTSAIIQSKLSLDGRILELTIQNTNINTSTQIKKKIVLDPGHGGYDPGAEYNGLYEKDIALDVAKRVRNYLKKSGFYVVMTREEDKTISLKERTEISNKENPDLFLSIHVNASKNPNIRGIETHWYTPKSRPLAIHLQEQMANRLVIPDRGIKNSRFYVIRNSNVPAVLAEIGYMSNETELYQLMTEERRESTAKSIAEGIINYIESTMIELEPDSRKEL